MKLLKNFIPLAFLLGGLVSTGSVSAAIIQYDVTGSGSLDGNVIWDFSGFVQLTIDLVDLDAARTASSDVGGFISGFEFNWNDGSNFFQAASPGNTLLFSSLKLTADDGSLYGNVAEANFCVFPCAIVDTNLNPIINNIFIAGVVAAQNGAQFFVETIDGDLNGVVQGPAQWSAGKLVPEATTPEPSVLLLMGAGLAGLTFFSSRRRRSSLELQHA